MYLGEASRAAGGDHPDGGGDRKEADNGLAEAVVGDLRDLDAIGDVNLLVRHGGGGAQLLA